MANHTQTGSISFEATNAASLRADGQYESLSDDLHDNYYTKSEFTVAPDKILSTVKEHSEQSARPNLSPFFSHPLTDIYNADENPDGYWANNLTGGNAQLSDGWTHYEVTNTASSTRWLTIYEHCAWRHANGDLKGDTYYTVLMEFRNVTMTGNVTASGITTHVSSWPSMFRTMPAAQDITEGATLYFTSKTVADPSAITGNSTSTRTLLNIPAGASISCDFRVSLYEGEYEGPYKPYVDQSLITRVSTAETAIEQNAEAITLRATKTEAQQMAQPNLSPWFSLQPIENDTEHWSINNGNTTFTPLEDGWVHLHNDNSSGTGVKHTDYQVMGSPSVTPGADYTWLFEYRNNNSTGNNQNYIVQSSERVQFWGNNVVKVLEGKSGGATTTLGPNQDFPPGTDGVYVKRVLKKAEAATSSHLDRTGTLYLGCLVCYAYAGAVADYDLRVSVYEGEYTGPYKPYSGTQLYASQAQLKVANDQIDLRVEKSGVIAAINASTEADGGSAVKISADKVNVEGAAIFTSGRLSQSSLNDAYDSKGAASAVQTNLDNLAIGGTNLLGGTANPSSKQIVLNTAATSTFGDVSNYNDAVTLYSFEDFDGYSNALKWTTSGTGNRGAGWYTKVGALKAGERYTFSCKVMSTVATNVHTHTAWRNGSATAGYAGWTSIGSVAIPANEWVDYSHSFVPSSNAELDWEFYVALCFSGNSGGATFRIAHAKLEHGNRATDWNPAPEDHTDYVDSISIGGRNLLIGTGDWSGFSNRSETIVVDGDVLTYPARTSQAWVYCANCYIPIEDVEGETLTLSFDYRSDDFSGTAGEHYVYVNFRSSSTVNGSRTKYRQISTSAFGGVFVPTTEWQRGSITFDFTGESFFNAGSGEANYVGVEFYNHTLNHMQLRHAKLEKGNRPTDWSPAPEDVTSRTQRIYYRTSSSTAPTSQYMPTAWVTETGDKWAANSTTVANWTAKATKLTNGSGTKYPYLFTCEQRQMGDGTIAYTTVLLDETTTVIDGGSIITNSIDANKLTVYDATIGKIKAEAIDVSAIKIGELDGASTVVSNASNGKSAYDRHTAYRGTCSTAAGTAAKVVTCTGFALATGATVEVYCSTANTANVPTLNVNSTGNKPIWINGAVASASNPCKWLAGDTVTFTYDGTRFRASLPVEGYVTEGTGGGLMVHRKSDATTGVKITDSVEILQNGTSVAEYGATARVGKSDSGHIEIASDSLTVYAKDYNSNLVKAATIKTVLMQSGLWNSLYFVDDNDNHDFASVYGTKYQTKTVAGVYAESIEEALVSIDAFNPHGTSMASIGLTATVQDSEVTITADSISLNGSLTLSTPLADSNLPTKGSAGTAGTSSATSGATLAVPYVTTDAYGRVTAKGTHTHTINNLPSTALPTVPVDKGGTGQTGVTTVTTVASFIAAASGVTISSVRVTVWGKLVHAYVVAKPSAAQSAAWVVGTVVSAYRPNAVVTGKPYYTGVDSARIMTDGTMQITACGAVEVGVSFTYLLA